MDLIRKILSSNDVGTTGTHQSGILIQKDDARKGVLPLLDGNVKNPDAPLKCVDEQGRYHEFRFVYYNNKRHDPDGTRDEYRITCMMAYLEKVGARCGDVLELRKQTGAAPYSVRVVRS